MTSRGHDTVKIGALLTGGRGRRASVDKRCLVLRGRTLLRRNLDLLHDLVPTVAVAVGTSQALDLGDAERVDVSQDAWPEGSPLTGITTALRHFAQPVFAWQPPSPPPCSTRAATAS